MMSIRPLISNSSSPPTKHLRTISSALITTDITVILMFNSFLGSPAKFKYLSFFLLSLTAKSKIRQILFLFVVNYHLVFWPGLGEQLSLLLLL